MLVAVFVANVSVTPFDLIFCHGPWRPQLFKQRFYLFLSSDGYPDMHHVSLRCRLHDILPLHHYCMLL